DRVRRDPEVLRARLGGRGVWWIESDLIRAQAAQRLQHARRAAEGVFVLMQAQAVVQLGRLLISGHDTRTSIDSACASSPSTRASGTMVGARRARPARVRRCTDITRTKSEALRPPRNRDAPAVGST